VDGNTSRKRKIAACFDREKYMRFGVRFDTKQQTGGSDEEPPVSFIPRSICPKSRAIFVQQTIKNDQYVPNRAPHSLKLNSP
jgi:hypothetical protein